MCLMKHLLWLNRSVENMNSGTDEQDVDVSPDA